MKSRNGYGEKDGRGKTSARKAQRVARSKPNSSVSESSVLLSVAGKSENLTNEERIETLEWGLVNSRQRIVEMIDDMAKVHSALEDLMCLYNRATGESDEASRGVGWTAEDVRRLAEIRQLLAPYVRAAI